MSDQITSYFRLCAVRLGDYSHVVDELPRADVGAIFTQREVELFLRERDGHYMARETVIGGGAERPARDKVIVIM